MRPLLLLLAFVAVAIGPAGVPRAFAQEGPPLRLWEFSSDPAESGNDGVYEWVELRNVSDGPVSLDGWAIGDAKSFDALPAVEVPAGGYVLVTGRSAAQPEGTLALRIADGIIGSGLNNGGDILRLRDPAGTVVDAVTYGSERTAGSDGPAAPPAGRSAAFDEAAGRWRTALEPTPGRENTFAGVVTAPAGTRPEVRFDAGSGMSTAGWVALSAAGVAGIAGAAEVAYRRRRR